MPEWTKEQKSAIEDRGGTLLVSAAAGSGKTAVLTERVLRRVTDPENPIDITELLLVTFTRAAAAEMRARLEARFDALGGEAMLGRELRPRSARRSRRTRPPCGCAVSFSSCTARRSRLCTRCACRSLASRRPRSASRRISV